MIPNVNQNPKAVEIFSGRKIKFFEEIFDFMLVTNEFYVKPYLEVLPRVKAISLSVAEENHL